MADLINTSLEKYSAPTASKLITQAFDSAGMPIDPVDSVAQKESNLKKVFAGQKPAQSGSQSSGPIPASEDTAALKQRGVFQEKGFFGDQTMSSSTTAFNNAASNAASFLGSAKSIASKSQKNQSKPRDKIENYYLYDKEKKMVQAKAEEFASYNVVPFDVLYEFLLILISVPNYQDLQYISKVVGIPELDDRSMVREPEKILNIRSLYKVGYLANGVASITKAFDPTFDVSTCGDNSASAFNMSDVAMIMQSPIGQVVTDLVGDLVGQVTSSLSLTSALSGIGGLGQLTSLAGQMTNLTSSLLNTSSIIQNTGIAGMMPAVGMIANISRIADNIANQSSHLSSLSQVAASSAKQADVLNQMSNIQQKVAKMSSAMGMVSSLLSGIQMPSISPEAAGLLKEKIGGSAASGIITELTQGIRVPPSKLYKNPMLMSPSYAGKAFFGEGPCPQGAVDQMFCKKIASFPQESCGGGTMSFGMQNFSSFGGALSLTQMVSKVMLGTTSVPQTGSLATIIAQKAALLASNLNISEDQVIEPRRSDNSIPFLIGMSAALVDDVRSPFETSVHTSSWKLAAATGNDVQRYHPMFLETCRTSL